MYDIRQFKPALYLLLLIGMTGFSLALQSPGMWLLGFGGVLANAMLVRAGKFRPLPRLVANLITIAAMIWTVRELRVGADSPVVVIGRFLVMLQLVKLWEQRANRDYGQLLVLSLLLMVAASINTASLAFALLLVAYLCVALYVCLLFHLKVETDAAKAALALPEEKVSPAVLKQDQRKLSMSMRRLTAAVSLAAVFMAVLVFLFFPRGTGANLFTPPQFRGGQAMVGFSDDINLNSVSSIQNNTAVVGYAQVWRNEELVKGGGVLLRGLTHDSYGPYGNGRWTRYGRGGNGMEIGADRDQAMDVAREMVKPPEGDVYRAKIRLEPIGSKALFTIPGAYWLRPSRSMRLQYGRDGAFTSDEPIHQPVEYEIIASGNVSTLFPTARSYNVDQRITAYARRPEISGQNAAGSLAAQRAAWLDRERAAFRERLAAEIAAIRHFDPRREAELRRDHAQREERRFVEEHASSAFDAEIAANLERHLKGPEFAYTLDLTDAKNRSGKDAYVWFLSEDGKRGHCEYFAGAMTLMCQGLGMQARVVTGFKTDEFNTMGDYFIIRQAHAHAWVEVLTKDGWVAFDPTSGRDVGATRSGEGLWQKIKHFFNYLEFNYANSVIAYDNNSRENLIDSVELSMTKPFYSAVNAGGPGGIFDSPLVRTLTDTLVAGGIVLVSLAVAGFLAWIVWKRVKLRRRAARIGIESLPPAEQLRLARQLGFYDSLLQLLQRHRIARADHMTPMEFSRSLMYLPADVYEQIRRLTGVFYRVRYGRAELSDGNQRRLGGVIRRIDTALGEALPAT